jgi:hypothetical protein
MQLSYWTVADSPVYQFATNADAFVPNHRISMPTTLTHQVTQETGQQTPPKYTHYHVASKAGSSKHVALMRHCDLSARDIGTFRKRLVFEQFQIMS